MYVYVGGGDSRNGSLTIAAANEEKIIDLFDDVLNVKTLLRRTWVQCNRSIQVNFLIS